MYVADFEDKQNDHHQYQNAWAAEARNTDFIGRECPRPTARSHSWWIEVVQPSPVWCS